MDGLDISRPTGTEADAYAGFSPAADPGAFQRMLEETDGQDAAGRGGGRAVPEIPPAAGFLASPGGTPALPPAADAAGAELEGAAGFLARNGLRAAGAAGVAGAILLTPTNTQRTTETDGVEGYAALGARISRAPGDLSGTVTIFARGADGRSGQDLTTLRMDPGGRLTAPGGDGAVLGARGADGGVRLAPGVGEALEARAGVPPRADAGGAGGKLPPGAGAVRPDGECDEDGTVGDSSPRSRLPANGSWTGAPGNSGWQSADPAVQAITKGEPIQFVDGRPDFTPWSRLSVNFKAGELTGFPRADREATYRALEASGNPDVRAAGSAEDFVEANDLIAHHATDSCMQLIPTVLNEKVAHIGGAADLRYQNSLKSNP